MTDRARDMDTVSQERASSDGGTRPQLKRPPSLSQLVQGFANRKGSAVGSASKAPLPPVKHLEDETPGEHNSHDEVQSNQRLRRPSRLGAQFGIPRAISRDPSPSASRGDTVHPPVNSGIPSLQAVCDGVLRRKQSISEGIGERSPGLGVSSVAMLASYSNSSAMSSESLASTSSASSQGTAVTLPDTAEEDFPQKHVGSSLQVDASTDKPRAMTVHETPDLVRHTEAALPLQHRWTFTFESHATALANATRAAAAHPGVAHARKTTSTYEAGLVCIGHVDTVPSFCRLFKWLKRPSRMGFQQNLHLFKDGIKPTWEHEANRLGGRWTIMIEDRQSEDVDRLWKWLCLALIGEDFGGQDDLITGAVLSTRPKMFRIHLWLGHCHDTSAVNAVGHRLVALLGLRDPKQHLPPPPHQSLVDVVSLEFSVHSKHGHPGGQTVFYSIKGQPALPRMNTTGYISASQLALRDQTAQPGGPLASVPQSIAMTRSTSLPAFNSVANHGSSWRERLAGARKTAALH